MKFGEIINDKLEYDWGYQMGYRLGRKFELRQTPEAQHKYNFEIQTLFPSFIENISHDNLENELYLLRKVFFPSVLETLIEGFERTGNQDRGSALTDGLPFEALQKRLVTLKYQHRMHPDISEFPREQIYQTLSLLDAAAIPNKRMNWRSGIRSRWVHTRANYSCKTSNKVEVSRIRELLQEFEKWTTNRDPVNGKYWEIAILSFYRDQEKLLRKMLQSYFKQSRWRTFTRGQLKVDVCTVDRFQGHEADLVILSMVRNRGVGFLDNINRLNVAITRPRYERIIVGDHTHFKTCNNEMLRNLAGHCKPEREYRRK
jgi:superfamily I DNA and/or RNA helicase